MWQKNEEENPFQACKSRTEARAFMPLKACPGFLRKDDKEELPVNGLSLGIKNPRDDTGSSCSRTSGNKSISSSIPNARTTGLQPPHQQPNRKQRRCWSPELHRRFVNALQQLGGSQG